MSRPAEDEDGLGPYNRSLAGTLLAAREAVMAPIRPVLRAAGVTEQQWRTLRVLADEGAIDASRLAASALLLAPSMTRILRELVDRGLVEREPDAADGRRSIVRITPAGRALVRRTSGKTRALLDSYTAAFGAARLDALIAEMHALALALEPFADAGAADDIDERRRA
ncbi:MAG TPA: homoprotocatechuate degradation operon regulator HpaR [Sphingomonadaceae bacterium]|nr:homoprotocatechuate degradation operon regulator HpaR [Sphingomonadaceae bacterium]